MVTLKLPADWSRGEEELTILVALSYDGTEVVYKLPVVVKFFDIVFKEQGDVEEPTIEWVPANAYIDEPGYEEDDSETVVSMEADEGDQCLPLYVRTNNKGQVKVRFNHIIAFKYDEADLAD